MQLGHLDFATVYLKHLPQFVLVLLSKLIIHGCCICVFSSFEIVKCVLETMFLSLQYSIAAKTLKASPMRITIFSQCHLTYITSTVDVGKVVQYTI